MIYLRSALFNFCFYSIVGLMCIIFVPAVILPRPICMWIAVFHLKVIYFLERHILNLNYEIRGAENLPKEGSFLVAAKHQSTYETLKLHFIFNDPAIILKRELLFIPVWGWFLARTNPIAINRSDRKKASKQIIEGAQRIMQEGRPIIIFPQGTRVRIDEDSKEKPYKIGIARMQEATGLAIIPMATNTGKFWPRNTWVKQSGTVVFEFLPPVTKDDRRPEEVIKHLEKIIETKSQDLLSE